MKEFQFKKKLEESNYENNLRITKEKEEKELNEFKSSLKNLLEIEINNLKSKFEKKITKQSLVVLLTVVMFLLLLTQIISRHFFNSSIIIFGFSWWMEFGILCLSISYFSRAVNTTTDLEKKFKDKRGKLLRNYT